MKAITLYQPWATLIALGKKEYETRSWSPRNHWRGELAIHAGNSDIGKEMFNQNPFRQVLQEAGYNDFNELPRGAVLCVCELVAVYDAWKLKPKIGAMEKAFGNYAPGRFAWRLKVKYVLPEPVQARGKQAIWNWNPE